MINRRRLALLSILAAACAIDVGASWTLNHSDLDPWARLAVALAPLPGNVALIAIVLARIRTLDEFQKCVHFEAVVVAFLTTGVAVFIYSYLRQANVVRPLNAGLVWVFMGTSYVVGYAIAIRQYR